MKKLFLAGAFFLVSCQANISRNQLEDQLKKTMTDFLYKGINYDSSKTKYHVLEVIFYEDQARYDCEFKVHMTETGHDTAGIMKAYISKDFKTVKRTY